ncbi:plasma membrane fusion protein prm1 [Tulasnella sp. 403]|nr:plasma membrane fusion protein prm1 [Tulasnella sp. 403]
MTTTFDERTQRDTMKTPTPSQLTHTSPSSTLTPYLTLPHLLSLTWLATPILSLLFIVFRLFDSTSSAQAASDDAKHTLLASCQAAQTAATVATNIPSFMAEGVNRNVQKAVNASIDAAKDTMIFAVLQRRLELVREGWGGDPAAGGSMDMSDRTLLSIFSSLEHPLATTFAQRLTDIFRLSPQKHINVRFFFNYVFYPPALACLLIGVFGILSVELQLIAIGPIQRHYSSVVAAQVNDFSQNIADNVNRDMLAQSTMYANSINTQIDTIQTSVNDGVFGWVNGTVVPLNNTLEAFYTDIQNAVQTVFGGTVLEAPMQEFVRCLIGSKVAALENALTFVQENFQVNVEKVDPQAFMLSDDSVQRATQPIAAAAVGGDSGDGNSQGLVGKLVNRYVESLKKERLMFLIFLGLWGIVVLMALAIIFWHSYGRAMVFRMGKRRYEKRARGVVGGEGVITPWVDQGRREGRESMSSPSGWFDPEKTFATSTNAPQKKIMTFSNIRPSVKEKKQALKPQREIVNLDDPSIERSESVSSDGSRTELTKKAKKRESRKLTADNRRPIREKLIMPDDDPYAVSRARKGSDTGVSVSAFSEDTAYPGSKPSEGGFLSKLSGMFGRRSSEEDDGEVPPPTWRESMARDSWKPRLLTVPKKDVEVMPGQSRASGDWRRDERRNIAAAGATSSVIDPSLMQGFTEEQKGKPGRKIQSTATIVPPTASTFGGKNPFSTPFDDDYRLGAPGALGVGRAS